MLDNQSEKNITVNKKVKHDYFILQSYEAGIVLVGTEVKSLRQGKANLVDSYAIIKDGEVWLLNSNISTYDQGSINNHDPVRNRKLLLKKNEIRKLIKSISEKGNTVVPIRLFFKGGKVKVEIAVVTGKRKYDKRDDIIKRELNREMHRKYK